MAKKKIIYVPRSYMIRFRDDEGNLVETSVSLNRDYEIKLTDGTTKFVTVRNVTPDKTGDNRFPTIDFDLEINPGYVNVLTESKTSISSEDIRDIKLVHAKYNRSFRTYKKGAENEAVRPKTKSFTFEFKSFRYNKPYRFVAYADEFIALVLSGPDGTRTNVYGTIEDVTDTHIIFTKYDARRGNRSIAFGVKIPVEKLLGIYRFEMEIEPFKEYNPDEKKTEAPNETISSDEGTALSID